MAFRSAICPVALAASMLAAGAMPLAAQSLADVARQEEARRKEIRRPAKVYTNKDLVSVPSPSPPLPTGSTTAADAAGKDAANDPAGDHPTQDTKAQGIVKDQAYWAKRMKDLTAQLDRDEVFFDALQSRVNALAADFAARDDPAQRAAIGRDRQKATDELERLRLAVLSDKKAVADFQEEARRASVPPGWLR